jgi:hypothetical protein
VLAAAKTKRAPIEHTGAHMDGLQQLLPGSDLDRARNARRRMLPYSTLCAVRNVRVLNRRGGHNRPSAPGTSILLLLTDRKSRREIARTSPADAKLVIAMERDSERVVFLHLYVRVSGDTD